MSQRAAFDLAFDQLLGQLSGDLSGFRTQRSQILDAAQGDPYRAGKLVGSRVGRDLWSWPEFERQFPPEEDDDYCALLSLGMKELRAMAGTRAKGRSADALVDAMEKEFHPDGFKQMEARAKEIVAERKAVRRYHERCITFAHRLANLGFSRANYLRMLESRQSVPGMKVKFLVGPRASSACRLMDRKSFPIDGMEHRSMAPCRKLDCACCWSPDVPRR